MDLTLQDRSTMVSNKSGWFPRRGLRLERRTSEGNHVETLPETSPSETNDEASKEYS